MATIRGNSSDNLLNGTPQDDLILGFAGNDTLRGRGRNDTLDGSFGADILDGGPGKDAMDGGDGNDTFIVDNRQDEVIEANNEGSDTVQSSINYILPANVETLILTGRSKLNGTGNNLDNTILGNSGNNKLNGNSGDDFIAGNDGNDTITGGQGDDTIQGGKGKDAIKGNGGDDLIEGDEGSDELLGGGGFDTLRGGKGGDTLRGGGSDDLLEGEVGNDFLDGGTGADTLRGGDGNDTYVVDGADLIEESVSGGLDTVLVAGDADIADFVNIENITLTGTADVQARGNGGNNSLIGNSGNNTLNGEGGDDYLDGQAGADTMIGGDGNDTYVVDDANDILLESPGAGVDTVISLLKSYTLGVSLDVLILGGETNLRGTGNDDDNTLIGNNVDNTLVGAGGSDRLEGRDGNDFLDGGLGADQMVGGLGNDVYVVDDIGDQIIELPNEGSDTLLSSISLTLVPDLENLILTGTENLSATGNAVANSITGNSGNNVLSGEGGADRLEGGDGNDSLDGGAGADTMIGGTGDDTYTVDNINDQVIEEAGQGIDLVLANVSYSIGNNVENLTLTGTANSVGTGNALNNTVTGNAGNNTLSGGDGNDYLDGQGGTDTMIGGRGDDTFVVDNAGDVVSERADEGADTAIADVSYTLGANVESLILRGATGTENLLGVGNDGNNTIIGNAGNNTIIGNGGDDVLDGGSGADLLQGGAGNDSYVVDNAGDVADETGGSGVDFVSASVDYTLGAGLDNLTLTGSALVGAGNDLVNTIIGTSGNNRLDGKAGADTLQGGTGDDTYVVDNAGDTVIEAADSGTDTVEASISYTLSSTLENLVLSGTADLNGTGNAANNSIVGNTGSNTLRGLAGNDTLVGNAGNDYLDGGTESDRLEGGAGNDTYVVDSAGDIVDETGPAGDIDTIISSVNFNLTSFPAIENLILTGNAVQGIGNTLDNTITGNAGNNDLKGGAGDDALIGGADNDTLEGGTGSDAMTGGSGDDSYFVDASGDSVNEAADEGTDIVYSTVSIDLADNVENLQLQGSGNISGTGNALDNTIIGNIGANRIDGGTGADTMQGGAQNDTYVVDNLDDVVTENLNEGTDTVESFVSYTLGANVENLTLIGFSGTEDLIGVGNGDSNTIIGNNGDNLLDGQGGADTLFGLLGDDTYVVNNAGDAVVEENGVIGGVDLVQASVSYSLVNNVENLTLTGTGSINGTGNTQDNTITGNSGNNRLDGREGADVMSGGAGNDSYFVDDVNDVVNEDQPDGGIDKVFAGFTYSLGANLENLELTGSGDIDGTGNSLVNTITGNSGSNRLDGREGADTLIGGEGDDTYVVDDTADVIQETGVDNVDTVLSSATYTLSDNLENLVLTGTADINGVGNALNNDIRGNSGNNLLNGRGGDDTLTGGEGDDTYVVDSAGDVVVETGADIDTVISSVSYTLGTTLENLILTGSLNLIGEGNASNNTIVGNSGSNTLNGLAGNDSLVGNDGSDRLNGGTGIDTMEGGAGNDTYVVDNAGDIVSETIAGAGGGIDTVESAVSYTLGDNLEHLVLTGTDNIVGFGNALNNSIIGNSGNNAINGGAGIDYMEGGAGNDTYTVDTAGDTVVETAPDGGTDTVISGVGFSLGANLENLTLTGDSSINGFGNDLVNTIQGNNGNNTLRGLAGDDVITGGAGDDYLDGGIDADTMRGGLGNDTYIVDNAGDVLEELDTDDGLDTVFASVDYSLAVNLENLILQGTAAVGDGNASNNTIQGNANDNQLFGRQGDDTLLGGSGNDYLDGGTGLDRMEGADGDDTYVVDNTGDTVVEAGTGVDWVRSSIDYSLGATLENLVLTGTANIQGLGNAAVNTIVGNSGNNYIDGGTGADDMSGGGGNDTYVVDNALDEVTEGADAGTDTAISGVSYTLGNNLENLTLTGGGNTTGIGNALTNSIIGNSGNNVIDGDAGADYMEGGAGNDTYTVDNVGDQVVETDLAGGIDLVNSSASFSLGANLENLTLTGGSNINGLGNDLVNTILGNTGNNTLRGLGGNDVLTDVDGNDYLDGGAGDDTMTGGVGNDTYVVDSAADQVTEAANGGTDWVISSVTYTLAPALENLRLAGNGNINGVGNTGANTIIGNDAANSILNGLSGDDYIDGRGGADGMIGGTGNDTYVIDNSADQITESAGEGTDIAFTSVSYTLGGSVSIEQLVLVAGAGDIDGVGNALNNSIVGNEGNNRLDGQGGADVMTGGAGSDTYIVDSAGDVVDDVSGTADAVIASVSFNLSTDGPSIEILELVGDAALTGIGNDLDNTIRGNNGANFLDGGAGTNLLIGGSGNDTYVINDESDRVIEAGPDTDIDEVRSRVSYTLDDNIENLVLLAGSGPINGTGNALNNTIIGNESTNALNGADGNDYLDGGGTGEADVMTGGIGDDTFIVDNTSDNIIEAPNAGVDVVRSSATYSLSANLEVLELTGTAAINGTGNASNNTIRGNSGANRIDGGSGADAMSGSGGNDTYVVDNAGDSVTEAAGAGTDLVLSAVTFSLGANVENLTLTGSATVNGTGNALANTITGNGGANRLDGLSGADRMEGLGGDDTYVVDTLLDQVVEATSAGTDTVETNITYTLGDNLENLILTGTGDINGTGNAAANTITGNSRNNILNGLVGADVMIGGLGDDIYFVDNRDDVVTELPGEGKDTVRSTVSYTISANVESLTLLDGAGNISGGGNTLVNQILGNEGNNRLDGKGVADGGGDTLSGGLGNDTYVIYTTEDVVTENADAGIDTVEVAAAATFNVSLEIDQFLNIENLVLGQGNNNINGTGNNRDNSIIGNLGNNVLSGLDGNDTIQGIGGTNRLEGGNGDDVLTGGIGVDTLVGGVGADTLTGGTGDDNFTFSGLSTSDLADFDTILDLQSNDTIQLSQSAFSGILGTGADGLGTLITSQFAELGSETEDTRIILDTATKSLFYVDGGTQTKFAELNPSEPLPGIDNTTFEVIA